jgi:copper(I)-binding protein
MSAQKTFLVLMALACAGSGCSKSGASITVTQLQIVAPAPGRQASVAYMTIHNGGNAPAELQTVSSSQYARVEIHETVLKDGIARMQALNGIVIEANSSVDFMPGGKHLMLFESKNVLQPGGDVSLQLYFASGAKVLVTSPLKTRIAID